MLLTGFSRCGAGAPSEPSPNNGHLVTAWTGYPIQKLSLALVARLPSAGAVKALETTKQEWPGTNFAAVVEWTSKSRRSRIRNVAVFLGHFGSAMQDSYTSLAESRWKRAKRERLCRLVCGFEGGVCCFLRS
jgi:hypothetical protein